MNGENPGSNKSPLSRLQPLLIELWIAAVLLTFFVIRVLGSSIGQRVLAHVGLHRSP